MIKLIVNEIPNKPEDCPFAIMDQDYHKHMPTLANCLLKHNDVLRNPRKEFTFKKNAYTCDPNNCPFLTT